ncbi:MAG TPA: hypothetical protein VND87_06300 [Stellaceae bacterium]|nr:hypothetical protein [Stellaceae bacterium]
MFDDSCPNVILVPLSDDDLSVAADLSVLIEQRAHPHYYCDAAVLVSLFSGFELLSLVQREHRKPGSWHWHIVAERRAT